MIYACILDLIQNLSKLWKKKLVWKAIPKLDFILDSKIKFCKKFSNISRMSHIKGKLIAVIGDEVSLKDIGFE